MSLRFPSYTATLSECVVCVVCFVVEPRFHSQMVLSPLLLCCIVSPRCHANLSGVLLCPVSFTEDGDALIYHFMLSCLLPRLLSFIVLSLLNKSLILHYCCILELISFCFCCMLP